jgi:hypothetical protein
MEKRIEEIIIPEWREFYINFTYFKSKLEILKQESTLPLN